MKKLLNKKFILILASTITLLVVLSIAMIFLTKENIKTFKQGGYIIASGIEEESNGIKYYFDEGTTYKTNVNEELVFKDTSGEKVNVETYNFLHYIDGGIKFLKNGVILDLESLNSTIVPYYNITNKSILEYSKGSYYIEAIDKTIAFNNLAGRISDNKYIFAGTNIKLLLAGSSEEVSGDYFEVTYIKDGIIRVENQEVSYQTTAQNSYILVNDNIRIDLGNKNVYFNNEEKMNLAQMTIDGNENILIDSVDKEEGNNNGGNDKDNEKDNQTDKPQVDNSNNDQNGNLDNSNNDNNQDNNEENNGNEEGNNTGNNTSTNQNNTTIELVKAEVGVNNISAEFILNNASSLKNDLVLNITNTDTGKRVYSVMIDKTKEKFNLDTSSLSPESNYVISINEENNGSYDTQYFQKLFKTNELGVRLEKKYITSTSAMYEVIFENDTLVKSAKVTLYNESYEQVGESVLITKDNNYALFEELANNTSYNIVLDDVIMENLEYGKSYSIYKSFKTLKLSPYLEGLTTEVDDELNTFTIGIKNIVDTDESITKYSYYIYDASLLTSDNIDTIDPVKIITKKDASKVNIGIDNVDILAKTNYKFKVVAEYYDNEKYNEFETELSDNFILSGKPTLEFTKDEENSSFNRIVGKISLKDDNCTIPMNGRSCSSRPFYTNNFTIDYKVINSTEKNTIENVTFNPYTLDYTLDVGSLIANTEYVFNVYGNVDLLDGKGIREGYLIGTFRVSTSSIDILSVENWKQNDSTLDNLVDVSARITSTNESMANSINNITFNLYAGDTVNQLKAGVIIDPIATKTVSGSLKEEYYNNTFRIDTLNTFSIKSESIYNEEEDTNTYISAIEVLKNKTDGKLQKYYTIEITDIYDNDYQNELLIENNYFVFQTPALLLMEDQLTTPTITAEEITNEDLKNLTEELENIENAPKYNSKYDKTTIMGYKINVIASLDKISEYFAGSNPVKELIIYACNADKNSACTIEEAVETKVIDLTTTDSLETYMFLKDGTKFNVTDSELTRGHNYVFKAKFSIDTDNDDIIDTKYPNADVSTDRKSALKQAPSYNFYILNTTENTVTYRYTFTDIDNALYDNIFYYTIDDTIKNKKDESSDKEESEESENDNEEVTDEVTDDETKENTIYEVPFGDGEFTLEGLSTDSVYDISFKTALIKKNNEIKSTKVGNYIFDGKFVYNSNTVSYKLVTNDNDNRLRIIILENENNTNYVNRISAYNIVLSAEGEEDYVLTYPTSKITKCTIDENDYKCMIVDYANIKNFKTKDISVNVTAYYDTGIINNDFANLSLTNIGYLLQVNSEYKNSLTRGNYYNLSLNTKNEYIIDTINYPNGILEYTNIKETKTGYSLMVKKQINESTLSFDKDNTSSEITLSRGKDAYYVLNKTGKYTSVNNKVVDSVVMNTDNNKFKFNSIIPKINVSYTGLVNGAVITIKPSGLDEEILKNEFKKEDDGKYYYYIRIYEDKEKTSLYKELKLEINPTSSSIELTKYMPNTTYYFEVSAYLLKDKTYKETKLFDAKSVSDYISSTYEFSTLAPAKIAFKKGISVSSKSDSDTYAKRTMDMYMDSSNTIGEYDTRFELYDINGKQIFSVKSSDTDNGGSFGPSQINKKLYNRASFAKDVSDMDIVFGKGYYTWKIFIEVEVEGYEEKQELQVYEEEISLTELTEPVITATRTSYEINSLSFDVTINDKDKVIKNGTYCVELLNSANKPISGYPTKCGISVVDDNGKEKINVEFSYDGLTADTLYIFRVYADIYTNNINETSKNRTIENRQVISTSTSYGVAIGSVASIGSKNSVTLSYSSGVNIGNIKKIEYTLMEKNAGEIASETYIMGDNKTFLVENNTYKLIIKPDNLSLESSKSYYVVMSYYVMKDGKLVLLNNKNYEHTIEF